MGSADRTRVVMLLDRLTPAAGGAEVFTVGLARSLPRDRFDVRVCTSRSAEGFLVEELHRASIPHLTLGRRASVDVTPFVRLGRYLRSERIDILHAHMFGSNLWGTVVGRTAGTPVRIAHEHTWSYEGQPLRKLIDGQVIARLASTFIAVSSADRERMISLERIPPEKIALIPAAFVPRGDPPRDGLRSELGIPADAPLIGTVVLMRPQKALDVMIDAVDLLRQRMPDVHLVAVGDGECREQWEAYAASRALANCVHFTGARSNADSLIAEFDVSALSSDFEGTPLFVFESMASSKPVVATDVGGLSDVVEDGESALLVPRRDPGALAAALERVLRDPELGRSLARAGKERLPDFSIERIAERTAELYDELLAAVPSR